MPNNKTVLIADDEDRMRKLVGDFLKKAGFRVLEAENGKVALDTFMTDPNINLDTGCHDAGYGRLDSLPGDQEDIQNTCDYAYCQR